MENNNKQINVRYKPSKMHTFLVNGTQFVVDTFYQPLKPLGSGAYGVVCSAIDLTTGKKVAIKKINKAFEDSQDAKCIIREIKILKHLNHPNIINLLDVISPPTNNEFEDIYMVLDFMEVDLHKIIYSKNQLSNEHIQYFIYQLLCALKYLHSANVIHRDLKPSNLLVNSNCDLKVCDFGLARSANDPSTFTEYVVTRWYRAPEIMCGCQQYDEKVDVWSVGCIMAELLGRQPIFPGDDYIHQMNVIFGILGTPSDEDIDDFITNANTQQYVRSLPKREPVPFSELFADAHPLGLDLLEKMLCFNPNKRISVDDALEHSYLHSLHAVQNEPICETPFVFSFDDAPSSRKQLKETVQQEIYDFRPYLNTDIKNGNAIPNRAKSRTI